MAHGHRDAYCRIVAAPRNSTRTNTMSDPHVPAVNTSKALSEVGRRRVSRKRLVALTAVLLATYLAIAAGCGGEPPQASSGSPIHKHVPTADKNTQPPLAREQTMPEFLDGVLGLVTDYWARTFDGSGL